MSRLPLSKRVIVMLVVVGVAAATSLVLALATASAGSDRPMPSPLIGLTVGVIAGGIYLALANNKRMEFGDDGARRAALAPVSDGSARVIVFRRGFMGKLVGIDVYIDGAMCTQLKSPRFAALTVTPGPHDLETKVQGKRSAPLAIEAVSGQTTMIEIEVGVARNTPVQRTDTPTLRATLAKTPMVTA